MQVKILLGSISRGRLIIAKQTVKYLKKSTCSTVRQYCLKLFKVYV